MKLCSSFVATCLEKWIELWWEIQVMSFFSFCAHDIQGYILVSFA
jgi:hypothetical protein